MKLTSLPLGTKCRIKAFGGTSFERQRRLMEMGFLPGTCLELAYRSCFKVPVAVRLRGCEVILGADDIAILEVEAA